MKRAFAKMLNAVKSEMCPYVFAVFQLIVLIFAVMPYANSPISTAGRVDHTFKVIMPSHLWVLVFSTILFALFYRIRKEGIEEKSIITIAFVATILSALNLVLHFMDDLLLWMWTTENVAIALYLTIPIIGVYKIANVFLLPTIRRFRQSKQH